MLANGMLLYTVNPKVAKKKKSNYYTSKMNSVKLSDKKFIQNSVVFYTLNHEQEILRKIQFIIASKIIKYLGLNLRR